MHLKHAVVWDASADFEVEFKQALGRTTLVKYTCEDRPAHAASDKIRQLHAASDKIRQLL